jgi:Cytidylate kinase-like family
MARVVCISHSTGAGGEEIGRLVAERLGFLYIDEEIVAKVAAKGGIDPSDVADAERRTSFVARMLEAFAQSGGEAWALGSPSPPAEHMGDEDIRALIREVIAQTAARGNVVIVAHAASHTVTPGQEAVRVLVTASPKTRATRVSDAERLDERRAARVVKDSDAGRRDYLKRFYDVDEELPTHYDIVVNTDVLTAEQAARVVAEATM